MTPATASDRKPQYVADRPSEQRLKVDDRRSTPPATVEENLDELYANIPCTD